VQFNQNEGDIEILSGVRRGRCSKRCNISSGWPLEVTANGSCRNNFIEAALI
jgi:hypothetical protein